VGGSRKRVPAAARPDRDERFVANAIARREASGNIKGIVRSAAALARG
jgi:hypothetical protein